MIVLIASNNHKYFDNIHYDYNYIENTLVLLKSIDTIHKDELVSIYLINYSNKDDSKFYTIHTNTIIQHLNKDGSNIEIRNFSAHLRAKVIYNEFKNKNVKYVLYLDTDTLIRKPLDELLNIDYSIPTIKILTRGTQISNLKFQSAVFLINNTKSTREMLAWWAVYIENNNKDTNIESWFADQRGLYLATKKYKINIIKLDEIYNDQFFKDISHIWHCKGKYHNNNWRKEYNKILHKIN